MNFHFLVLHAQLHYSMWNNSNLTWHKKIDENHTKQQNKSIKYKQLVQAIGWTFTNPFYFLVTKTTAYAHI